MPLRIAILFGSMRQNRLGIRAVRFFDAALQRRGHTTRVIDAMEQNLPLLDKMYKEYEKGKAPPNLESLAEIYRNADAFLIVSGEYNHNIPPGLKTSSTIFSKSISSARRRSSAIRSGPSAAFGPRCPCA